MIVYGDRRRKRDLRAGLREVDKRAGSAADHAAIRDLIVDYGDLEVALIDALCREQDDLHPVAEAAGAAAEALGHALAESWLSGIDTARPRLTQFRAALATLQSRALPEIVEHGAAEGYAFYGLYPECYIEAARQARAAIGFDRAVVLGLRGIGASLSAVVTGALRREGCSVTRLTVRPRGHPFDRRPVLGPRLTGMLRASVQDSAVLIVDEGPGLSGSSFAGAAAMISELGVPADRIALLPSYEPDPGALLSEAARSCWSLHRSFVASFESVWPACALGPRDHLQEISGGAWRSVVYGGGDLWPAVQPQHEGRKYLGRGTGGPVQFKFSGLADYGAGKLAIAQALAQTGWVPRVHGIADGFLVQDWIDARPLRSADGPAVLARLADYLAFRRARFPLDRPVPLDDLFGMAAQALDESLGPGAAAVLDGFDRRLLADAPVIAVDGRMLPHEWLRAADGRILKADALDHHDDHFFPGPQDGAWDLAGASIEFALSKDAERGLVELYAESAGDPFIGARLSFYRMAYAAWRLGYCRLAAQTLGDHLDGLRFRGLSEHYERVLGTELQSAQATRISARAGPRRQPSPP